jgi:Purple acid Phosphatase, N-terminal domain/Bacterial Ig-like domain
MRKKSRIPTIIGIAILLAGTFAGVFFLRMNQVFRIGASATAIPKDVRTGNLSDTSATISWITEGATTDFISWGETQQSLSKVEKETSTDQKFFTHSITLTGLKGNTTYHYKINSEGTNFDNNGIPWRFTTGDQITINQNFNPISGSVITSSGQASKRALVYVTVDGYLLSTLTSDSGNFVLQLGSVRTSDLKQIAQIEKAKTLLSVSIQAEGGETASAQIFPQSANPMPPLVLGQVQDYRSLPPNQDGQNPNVNLNLPADTIQESKFNVSTDSGVVKPTSVILESINEGEIVTSTQPQFFGKGPAGEAISITIHSEQTVPQTVQIPKTGSWSYSPVAPLSEGPHSVIISWIDATGITRTLTRNFVVQAGEVPAFVASPSGSTPSPTPTLGPTITPRVTSTATPTPKPTGTASPSATLRASPSVTPEPVPVTGNLTPTLLLSIMGIAIIAFSVYVWRFSDT